MSIRCDPAATVIRSLGGVRVLARALEVSPELVSQWQRPAIRGGTGGWIPRKWWPRLAVDRALLKTGRREKLDVGRASKIKGDRFEYQVVRELVTAGFFAHRVPLSGAVKGYPGDVRVDPTPTGPWVLQCKISSSSGGRVAVVRFLCEVTVGHVDIGKHRYVAMHSGVFLDLMRGKLARPVNWPQMRTPGKGISDAITGHDALVFRRDGVTDWFALVREEKWR